MPASFNVSSPPGLRDSDLTHRHGNAFVIAAFGAVALLLMAIAVHVATGHDPAGGIAWVDDISDALSD